MKNALFGPINMEDSPMSKALFGSSKFSWLWLVVRLYVGYQWLTASIHKLTSPEWMQTGEALKGYWMHAAAIPDAPAKPAIYYDWYRTFIQSMLDHNSYVWFAKLIAIGEFLVGVALILGLFVGVAAFFGGLMNLNFMLAGSLSSGPILFVLEILLIIAWKTAGYYGLDRVFFKFIGAPWKPGVWLQKKTA
jgi:thiosulfate dehydrogenase (quinone) large subunit